MDIGSKNPLEASMSFIEKVCDAELREVRSSFDAIEIGLGEKAVKLVKIFSASFGVKPGQAEVTRARLNDLVESRELDYDFEQGLFYIEGNNLDRFYLDPMNRFGNPQLFNSVMSIARKMHDAFSKHTSKKVEVEDSSLGASILEISFYPKVRAEETKQV